MHTDCCIAELEEIMKRLVRLIQLFERDKIAIYGFSSAQYYTMLEIWRSPGITMNEISNKLKVASSTATRVVDKLVKTNQIERYRSEQDRRVVHLKLTDSGEQAIIQVHDTVSQYYRTIIQHITNGQISNVLESTTMLLQAVEAANPYCC